MDVVGTMEIQISYPLLNWLSFLLKVINGLHFILTLQWPCIATLAIEQCDFSSHVCFLLYLVVELVVAFAGVLG